MIRIARFFYVATKPEKGDVFFEHELRTIYSKSFIIEYGKKPDELFFRAFPGLMYFEKDLDDDMATKLLDDLIQNGVGRLPDSELTEETLKQCARIASRDHGMMLEMMWTIKIEGPGIKKTVRFMDVRAEPEMLRIFKDCDLKICAVTQNAIGARVRVGPP